MPYSKEHAEEIPLGVEPSRDCRRPDVLGVDLNGLEHGGQGCGGEQHIGRDLALTEYAALAGANTLAVTNSLIAARPEPLEIGAFSQDPPTGSEPPGPSHRARIAVPGAAVDLDVKANGEVSLKSAMTGHDRA
jgi:hypothetical protein